MLIYRFQCHLVLDHPSYTFGFNQHIVEVYLRSFATERNTHGVRTHKISQCVVTPAITATQTGKEKYCNFNQNDEILISIIFQHINMSIFVVAVHAPTELPPCPTQ